jgi:chorismate synthase
MKPIPSLMKPLASVNIATKKAAKAAAVRSDVCAVPAAAVVGEAMTACVLAAAVRDKFGGDSVSELRDNLRASLRRRA